MIGLVISGHGKFASGLFSSLKFISGIHDNLYTVDFEEDMGVEDYKEKLRHSIENLSFCDHIIIYTDIPGGTPFNQSALLTQSYGNLTVVGGANLPVIIETLFKREAEVKELLETISSLGENAFTVFSY